MNKKAMLARFLSRSGLGSLLGRMSGRSGLLVLTYHRIGDAKGALFDRGLWSADAETFADQVRFCKLHLDMITPDDLPRVLASGQGRYGMITFDDGYRDNYEAAFPVLKREGVPATFFITTGFIDNPRVPWWDEIAWMVRTSKKDRIEMPGRLSAVVSFDEPDRQQVVQALLRHYRTLNVESTDSFLDAIAGATGSGRCKPEAGQDLWMTWDMVREMRASGMAIGGHTVSHPLLLRASRERQRAEITGCAGRLAHETGEPMRYFSYTSGGRNVFDAFTQDLLREAGVRYAFSYYGGFRSFRDWDDCDIRRVAVESDMTNDWFRSLIAMPGLFA